MVVLATTLYPDTCTVGRRTAGTPDAAGQPGYTYPEQVTELACRFQAAGDELRVGHSGMIIILERPRLLCAHDADILIGDRLSSMVRSGSVEVAGEFDVVEKSVILVGPTVGNNADHMELQLEQIATGA